MSGFGYNMDDHHRAASHGNTMADQGAAGTINGGWASQMPAAYKEQLETAARMKRIAEASMPFPLPSTDGGSGGYASGGGISIPMGALVVGALKVAVFGTLAIVVSIAALTGIGWATAPSMDGIDVAATRSAMPDSANYRTDDPRVQAIARKSVPAIVKDHFPERFYGQASADQVAARKALWLKWLANPSLFDSLDAEARGVATNEAIRSLPNTAQAKIDAGRAYYHGFYRRPGREQYARETWRQNSLRFPNDPTLHALALDGVSTQDRFLHYLERGWNLVSPQAR